MRTPDADALLADLDPDQATAVRATSGPVCILAGAGTGKTRTLTRRIAYGAATGAIDPAKTLIVTFTRDAAREMRERLDSLGVRGVNAATFHSAALAQLRHFYPQIHGTDAPSVIESSYGLVARAAKPLLTGAERYTPTRDLVAEIEWAKVRRIRPEGYERAAAAALRESPVELRRMAQVYAAYERAKAADGRLDFTDMLGLLADLLADHASLRDQVRARYAHFSVDEFQDTSPIQDELLGLWLDGRREVAVVGDPEQTIYSFAGASADFLTSFRTRYPDAAVVRLLTNYRSTPEVIAIANRLAVPVGSGRVGDLRAVAPSGPAVRYHEADDADAELAVLTDGIGALLRDGVAASEIAVLVRLNAALVPIEAALARAGIAYRLVGDSFFARPDVRRVADDLRAAVRKQADAPASEVLAKILRARLGYDPDAPAVGDEAIGRAAAAETLLAMASGAADVAALIAEIDARAVAEAQGSADGVSLLTIHRAKGLEWEAVFLPGLEEGTLPIRQALGKPAAIAEERRLAYVAVTRARRHLALSAARSRPTSTGSAGARKPSRFLAAAGLVEGPVPGRVRVLPDAQGPAPRRESSPLGDALRAWRSERAKADGVPAYVVATNETLDAIVDAKPASRAALRRVRGMGEKRLESYGDEIIAVVARAG